MTKVRVGSGVTVRGGRPSNIKVSEDGAFKGSQPEINFTGNVNVSNDPTNNKINIDIPSTNSGYQLLIITETALVDGATIDLAQQNNTLATSRTTITFTVSNTATFIYLTITLTGTALVLTFPANSLCVSEGTASGNNTCSLAGVSGDKYEIALKKRGATYSVVSKNINR